VQALLGLHVLFTRPKEEWGNHAESDHAARAARELFEDAGATTSWVPLQHLGPPEDLEPLRRAARGLATYDWVIFTSQHGVQALELACALEREPFGLPSSPRIASVGPTTTARVRRAGAEVDLEASRHDGDGLADALLERLRTERGDAPARILFPRAREARETLPARLRAAGHDVDLVVAYETRAITPGPPELAPACVRSDVVIVASASAATALHAALHAEGALHVLERPLLAALGPFVAVTLRALIREPEVIAHPSTMPGLLAALVERRSKPDRR
jgi:uroporphyrinogen-III synthase